LAALVSIAALAGVTGRDAGLASGLVNTSRLVGGALGLAILAALAAARTNSDLHRRVADSAHVALTNGFQLAFLIAAGFSLIGGLVAAFGMPRIKPRAAGPRAQPAAAES